MTTNSEVIQFNSAFYNFFTILGGEINPVINNNEKIDNLEDWAIYIDPADIVKLEEQDDDSQYNMCIYNGRFYMRNTVDENAEDILIQAEGEKEIYISEEVIELMRKNKGLVYLKDLDEDSKIFEMVIIISWSPLLVIISKKPL